MNEVNEVKKDVIYYEPTDDRTGFRVCLETDNKELLCSDVKNMLSNVSITNIRVIWFPPNSRFEITGVPAFTKADAMDVYSCLMERMEQISNPC